MSNPKISVITLGCSKNVVDSEVLLGRLKLEQATVVDDVEDADIAVINTCGFIADAKQESIDAIIEAVERKKKGSLRKVIVMGCLSERYSRELKEEIPDVDAYFGSNQQMNVVNELGIDFKKELLGERVLTTPSHFAYLKISEGCDRPCSFCAIPLMRGLHRTRPFEEVIAESRTLAEAGVKELILIGQDTTFYGVDLYGERRLGNLLQELDKIQGFEWIRLMYAYPAGFPLEVLEVMRGASRICHYIDLPLQHASDSVLKSMKRGITRGATRTLLEKMFTALPRLAVRSTFIVGYPNETEKDFQTLYDFVKEWEFHRVGVFKYSHEEGTTADVLGDPIPAEVKEERYNALMELQRGISEKRNEQLVGTTLKVLIDRKEDGFAVGRSEWDAPEIDQEIYLQDSPMLAVGNFYETEIVEAREYDLHGTMMVSAV